MGKQPTDVDAYLDEVPEPARSTLEKVRKAIRAAAPEAEESITYAIPTYKYKGERLIYFAAFKKHCSIYPTDDAEWEEFKKEFEAAGAEKTSTGTLQFPIDKPIPAALIKKILKRRMKLIGAGKK